jgi:hypothetical protein
MLLLLLRTLPMHPKHTSPALPGQQHYPAEHSRAEVPRSCQVFESKAHCSTVHIMCMAACAVGRFILAFLTKATMIVCCSPRVRG